MDIVFAAAVPSVRAAAGDQVVEIFVIPGRGPSVREPGIQLHTQCLPLDSGLALSHAPRNGANLRFVYTSRLRSTAASMNDANSGCGSNGRDFSSGWNCTPTNQGWSSYSTISGRMPSGDDPGEPHAVLFEPVLVGGVDLVAVPVPLGDFGRTVDVGDAAAAREDRRISAEPHGAAEIAVGRALLERIALQPFGHQADYGLLGRTELGRIGVLDAAQIARRLDHRHLHAEADAEIGNVALSGELRGADLSLGAALAEAAGHQNAVDVFEERRRVLVLEHFRTRSSPD